MQVSARALKLPRVTAMAACTIRERDWANVVTAHYQHPSAYVWSLQSKALGKHVLTPPSLDDSHSAAAVTAVAISPCGNTALVATEAGTIDAFNLQSGLHRAHYVRQLSATGETRTAVAGRAVGPAPPAMSTKTLLASMQRNEAAAAAAGAGAVRPAHDSGVVSVAVDACNRWMVSCGMDGFVRVWAYKQRTLQQQWSAGCALRHGALHAASGLLATSGDDLVIGVYDVVAGRRVRRLKGHTDRLTAVHWAADARWLLSASMDGTTRVWDIPAAQCLQVMHLGAPVTALSMSPCMDLLVTTHVGRVGLYLWANRPLYLGTAAAAAAAMGAAAAAGEAAVVDIRMPSVSDAVTHREEGMEEGAGGAVEVDEEHTTAVHEVEQMVAQLQGDGEAVDERGALPVAAGVVTLAKVPKSQWQSLMHLDTIKQRNKPILPPTKPQAAPFFLPTVGSVSGETVFDVAAAADQAGGGNHGSKLLRGDRSAAAVLSEFVRRLQQGAAQGDFALLTEHVRGLGPAALDVELQVAVAVTRLLFMG
jgi:U3 small nucleolar RNA-associated protein 21